MLDTIILIVCGSLFVILSFVLLWWLETGKAKFIEKRCKPKDKKDVNKSKGNNNE